MTPSDGEPIYGGWPAFYRYFFREFGWTLEETNACPLYLACLLLGAIGPDHVGVKMTVGDARRYYPERMLG